MALKTHFISFVWRGGGVSRDPPFSPPSAISLQLNRFEASIDPRYFFSLYHPGLHKFDDCRRDAFPYNEKKGLEGWKIRNG